MKSSTSLPNFLLVRKEDLAQYVGIVRALGGAERHRGYLCWRWCRATCEPRPPELHGPPSQRPNFQPVFRIL